MDGKRVQDFFRNEAISLLSRYRQFELLIPNESTNGAAHRGEDGRFVENMIRVYLQRFLPAELKVFGGFILRPAVKVGSHSRERANEQDAHSTQIDIIVYDHSKYPIYEQFNECVIVPPEGVIAAISVKKTFYDTNIYEETKKLFEISKICKFKNNGEMVRAPYYALIGMSSKIEKKEQNTFEWIFSQMSSVYSDKPFFDETIGLI